MKRITTYLFIFFINITYGNDTLLVDSLNEFSYHLGSSFPDSAFNIAKNSYEIAKKHQCFSRQITAIQRMSAALYYKGEYDKAIYHLRVAEQLFYKEGSDSSALAKIYLIQALIHKKNGENNISMKKYGEVYKLGILTGDSLVVSSCLINISNLLKVEAKYKEALSVLYNARSYISKNNYVSVSAVYHNIGNIYELQERYSDALNAFNLAKNNAIKAQKHYSIAKTLLSIGNVYLNLEKNDSALFFYNAVNSLATTYDFEELKGTVFHAKGELYYSENKLDSAYLYYLKSIEIKEKIDAISCQPITYTRLGDYYSSNNQLSEAKSSYLKGYAISKKINDVVELEYVTYKISNIYARLNKLDSSNFYLKESYVYKDSINDNFNKLYQYEINYDREKYKVAKLEATIENKDLKIENQQQFIWYSAIVVAVLLILLYFVVRLFMQKKKNYRIEQKNLQAQKEIDHLIVEQDEKEINAMLDGQETERNRIASEIHDKLGGTLAVVKMYFKSMNKQIDRLKEENKIQFEKANELLDEACDEARKIAHNLSSGLISKLGLFTVVKNLKNKIEGAGEIKMEVHVYGVDDELKNLNEIAVFRIIQELVSNILKHAKAKEINIQLNVFDNLFNLIIEDNGVGFDVNKMKDNTGIGLRGVGVRVKKMNGILTVDSSIGKGTTISIDLPLKEEKNKFNTLE